MFCLSAKGLQRVNDQLEPNFTLYINNNPISVSKFIISFFSNKIFQVLKLNPSLNSYSINVNLNTNSNSDSNNNKKVIEEEYIKDIKNLMIGKSVEISKEKSIIMEKIGEELGNGELIKISIEKMLEDEEINVKNCIERTKRKERNNISIEEEEEYLTKHFSEIEVQDLEELDVKLLEKILNRKDLMIKSEEEIIDKIKSLPKEYRILIKEVDITNVTGKYLTEYINLIEEDNLIVEVWPRIRNKLLEHSLNLNLKEERKFKKIEHTEGENFAGIFKYLEDKYEKNIFFNNIHKKRIISISTSSSTDSYPERAIDFERDYYWNSLNRTGEWWETNFKEMKVKMTGYSIMSIDFEVNNVHLKNWVIEGKNEGEEWKEINRHINDNFLNGPKYQHYYSIKEEKTEPYQYIRIRNIGEDHLHDNYLSFVHFEIYGELYGEKNED